MSTPAGQVSLTWLAHAAFLLTHEQDAILIDPWLSENPQSCGLPAGVRPTMILVSHGHFDHLGDAVALSQEHDAPILAPGETGIYCTRQGATAPIFNIGGTRRCGGAQITCVPAVHSSSVGPEREYGGQAAGFVIELGGLTIYHAGDTALFGDMRLIGARHPLDLALLPTGGTSTMGPSDAVEAVRLLTPRTVAPMHFGTWDFLEPDAVAFTDGVVNSTATAVLPLEIGVPFSLSDAVSGPSTAAPTQG